MWPLRIINGNQRAICDNIIYTSDLSNLETKANACFLLQYD